MDNITSFLNLLQIFILGVNSGIKVQEMAQSDKKN